MSLFDFFIDIATEIDIACTTVEIRKLQREIEREMNNYPSSRPTQTSKPKNEFNREKAKIRLMSCLENYLNQAAILEKKSSEIVYDYSNTLIKTIKNSSAYYKRNIRCPQITKQKITSEIQETIKQPLRERMTLNNTTCLEMLKKNSEKQQEESIKNFARKIQKEALNNLAKFMKEFLKKQFEYTKEQIEDSLVEQKRMVISLKRDYSQICKMNFQKEEMYQKKYMEALFVIKEVEEISKLLQ